MISDVLIWVIVSSVIASEDMELDPSPEVEPEPDPEPEPSSALRIRLKVNNESRRPSRAAAKKSGKRTKRVALEAAMGMFP